MDREILFRGKEVRYGRWIEGYYNRTWLTNGEIITEIRDVERPHHMQAFIEVNPASVGKFTGLTDKNGKRIFEGDLLRLTCSEYPSAEELFSVWFGPYKLTGEDNYDCVVGWYTQGEGKSKLCGAHSLFVDVERANMYYEVIGNIYDNPELLEGDGDGVWNAKG